MQITIALFIAFLAGWYVRRKAHDGVSMQYAESVVGKVAAWLEEKQYPKCIEGNGKQFRVTYQAAAESR